VLQAIAYKDLMLESAVVSGTYTINLPNAYTNFFNQLYSGTRTSTPWSVGFELIPSTALTVHALGRSVSTSMSQNHTLQIWRVSDQTLIASIMITPDSSTDSLGYKYAVLSRPVTLLSGVAYRFTTQEYQTGDLLATYMTIDNHTGAGTVVQSVTAAVPLTYPTITGAAGQGAGLITFYYGGA
jgi:hypothetical protein